MALWAAKGMGVLFGGVTDEDTSEETMESVFHNDLYGYQIAGNGRWVSMMLKRPKKKSGAQKKKVPQPQQQQQREFEAEAEYDYDEGEEGSDVEVEDKVRDRYGQCAAVEGSHQASYRKTGSLRSPRKLAHCRSPRRLHLYQRTKLTPTTQCSRSRYRGTTPCSQFCAIPSTCTSLLCMPHYRHPLIATDAKLWRDLREGLA